MTRTVRGLCAGTAFLLLGAASPGAGAGGTGGLGNVHFASSCGVSVAPAVDRSFALLYSFWYDRALDAFKDVIARDPGCAIAYWGAAMTYNHPLWGPPTATDLRDGIAFLKRSAPANERSPRESAYLDAATVLFGDGDPAAKRARDEAYAAKMARAYAAFPDDDTALFYALAVEGTYRWGVTPQKIELAGKLAETVHAHQPAHPGALHYIIHAYDQSGYEERALDAARQYAASAPAIPHALHMPSHTFVALGLWQESNATNERALASEPTATAPWSQNFHELWFLEYGYLQTGDTAKAKDIAQKALVVYDDSVKHYHDVDADTASDRYDMDEMLDTVIAYGMETGDYALAPATSDDGLGPPSIAARMEYGVMQALGAKNAAAARTRADALLAYAKSDAVQAKHQVAVEVDIAAFVADGEARMASGDTTAGLTTLARAAKEEATAHEIFEPLEHLPAEEMYGRELLRLGRFAEAEQQLRAALALTPNRTAATKALELARTQQGTAQRN
jgi:tetratricopeptide (TPR) repeat protein